MVFLNKLLTQKHNIFCFELAPTPCTRLSIFLHPRNYARYLVWKLATFGRPASRAATWRRPRDQPREASTEANGGAPGHPADSSVRPSKQLEWLRHLNLVWHVWQHTARRTTTAHSGQCDYDSNGPLALALPYYLE